MTLPSFVMLPGPTATTSASDAFDCDDSGNKMPPAVYAKKYEEKERNERN